MSSIPKLNEDVMKACQLYVDNLIKPIHSLGKLEEMVVRIAGITGIVKPSYLSKALVISAVIRQWTEKIKQKASSLMMK